MRVRLSLIGGTQPSEHVFEVQGGTFGRSLKCDWVLSDEERILSSIHGRVVFENNKFMLVDESTNGIFLDGRQQPLGRGNGVALVGGFRFRAAKHLIEAQLLAAAAFSPAPTSGPALPQAYQPVWQNAAPSAEQALRERGDMGDVWAKNSQDPLAYLGSAPWPEAASPDPAASAISYVDPLFSPPPRQTDPFAGMIANGQPAMPAPQPIPAHFMPGPDPREQFLSPASPPQPAFSHQPATGLPMGFEPLQSWPPVASQPSVAAPPSSAPQPMPAAGPQKLIPDDFDPLSILASPARRNRELRQEPGNTAASPFGHQPLAANPPAQSAPTPPLLGPVPLPPAREPLSPSLMADLARLSEPAATRPAGPEQPAGEFDAIEAMKARREERKARLIEKAAGDGHPRPVVPASAQIPASIPGVPLPSIAPIFPGPLEPQPPLAAAPGEPFGAVSDQPLQPIGRTGADGTALVALFTGMGLPGADISPDRQKQVMQEVGEMVRAFSDGLILLLSARRMVKSEFRMDETQVQPEENNPFKHFKMAELALDELFVTRSGGFQAPGEAAQSALEDLKQHVMLTMAAMQRAIKLLMERLSPEHAARDNEAEGTHRIRGLGARKGKWETYVDMHQRMSSNFDGVARQLIAEAFAQVQEEQARRIASQYWENKK
ncbi:type VI secretion system-associated FHA domain protein TagH [Neorhizobium sp. T7_12]|uniref:type VI secretion system-associated FHA domain protein TagH n=1 Tax=Neorhizobium sp. T7_12 TaxID=2093832 RepID=UPI000CF8C6A1|nr:type VI secretion system-associated FHA domain protein TagH [Neorhizobium sp. T7_12]